MHRLSSKLKCEWVQYVSSTWEDGLDDLWDAVEELVRDEASEQERRRQESFAFCFRTESRCRVEVFVLKDYLQKQALIVPALFCGRNGLFEEARPVGLSSSVLPWTCPSELWQARAAARQLSVSEIFNPRRYSKPNARRRRQQIVCLIMPVH